MQEEEAVFWRRPLFPDPRFPQQEQWKGRVQGSAVLVQCSLMVMVRERVMDTLVRILYGVKSFWGMRESNGAALVICNWGVALQRIQLCSLVDTSNKSRPH
jgi:hypothetical protein